MKTYTVKRLAKVAGVSVRTLHHYDEIGLLKPAFVAGNGYRHYGEDELLRLQQILIHRELSMPLAEIATVLDAPDFDRLKVLQAQREYLQQQAKRFAGMVRTIDRTIASLKGERAMKDAELYSGVVSPETQARHEQWLVDRYGPEMESAIEAARPAMAELTEAGRAARMDELKEIEDAFADALRSGVPPQAAALEPVIERHRKWVAESWNRDCPPQAYAGLADIYMHPDFRARYEAIAEGLTDYLTAAIKSWAARHD
jgi:DNA-binding transcriptional MerR regulator